jgi:poly [ADP-ribose] polymerase
MLREKLRLLEDLDNIGAAARMLSGTSAQGAHPIDVCYGNLGCEIRALGRGDAQRGDAQRGDALIRSDIARLLSSTHGPTHTQWAMEAAEIFEINRNGEVSAPYTEMER